MGVYSTRYLTVDEALERISTQLPVALNSQLDVLVELAVDVVAEFFDPEEPGLLRAEKCEFFLDIVNRLDSRYPSSGYISRRHELLSDAMYVLFKESTLNNFIVNDGGVED